MADAPAFERWTRDHWSCLLYLESRIVDHGGAGSRSDPHMNSDDWAAVDDFVSGGLLVWGGTGFHPIFSFTDAGWAVAHALRRLRAEGVPHDSSRHAVAAAAFLSASKPASGEGDAESLDRLRDHALAGLDSIATEMLHAPDHGLRERIRERIDQLHAELRAWQSPSIDGDHDVDDIPY